jgi:hypothetical protein
MRTIKTSFAVLAVFLFVQPASSVFGVPAKCTDHREHPTRLIDWGWSAGAQFTATSSKVSYKYALAQNFTKPFNPSTTIAYSIASETDVTLAIFDVQGKLVRTLVSDRQTPSNCRVTWGGTDNRDVSVASGVYFYRLTAGEFVATRKMVLLR